MQMWTMLIVIKGHLLPLSRLPFHLFISRSPPVLRRSDSSSRAPALALVSGVIPGDRLRSEPAKCEQATQTSAPPPPHVHLRLLG